MSTYTVRAKRWKHGWELHIEGIGVTQSRNLDGAEQMVRDYIETLTDHDTADDAVIIHPEVGSGLDEAADAVRVLGVGQVLLVVAVPAPSLDNSVLSRGATGKATTPQLFSWYPYLSTGGRTKVAVKLRSIAEEVSWS